MLKFISHYINIHQKHNAYHLSSNDKTAITQQGITIFDKNMKKIALSFATVV